MSNAANVTQDYLIQAALHFSRQSMAWVNPLLPSLPVSNQDLTEQKMNSYKEDNRRRLIKLLDQIEVNQAPDGWIHVGGIAVGGLEAVGFSQQGPYLLVVSSAGRSVVHCDSGKKIERDYEENAGFTESGLHCRGIGVIAEEIISLGGIYGGGLPMANSAGETLEVASPEWPESQLILTKPFKHPFIDGHQDDCSVIYSGYLSAYGFSWCGNYIVAACSSDLDLWARETALQP